MPFIKSFSIEPDVKHPFPFNLSAVQNAKNIILNDRITFIIGDNGTGKSTLLETLAFRLQLPHMDGSEYSKPSFNTARRLLPYLHLKWNMMRSIGFFFRAEDFGDLINSVYRSDQALYRSLQSLKGEVPDHIIKEMVENANSQRKHVRLNYGQDLQSYSHGEAYLKIMSEKITERGIYILDEPEAALSPNKQLSLIYFIQEHLSRHASQFIVATHSPILMSIPHSKIYELRDNSMEETALEDTEHYSITKSFLNHPEAFLRKLND